MNSVCGPRFFELDFLTDVGLQPPKDDGRLRTNQSSPLNARHQGTNGGRETREERNEASCVSQIKSVAKLEKYITRGSFDCYRSVCFV
jgi:hypothetical protein